MKIVQFLTNNQSQITANQSQYTGRFHVVCTPSNVINRSELAEDGKPTAAKKYAGATVIVVVQFYLNYF